MKIRLLAHAASWHLTGIISIDSKYSVIPCVHSVSDRFLSCAANLETSTGGTASSSAAASRSSFINLPGMTKQRAEKVA